jgi:urea ABC transporter urea binding protein
MKEIRVGILHSLSGSLASTETPLVDAALFAIDEINKQGGLLGKQLMGIVEDGCSEPETFKLKAEKLIEQDKVHVVSGCWTSSSRKTVMDIVQHKNVFLLYPTQYEGLEENPNILYSGSCLNQQISPGIDWCLTQGHRNFYLVGSDYVFPRTTNALIKSLLSNRGANILGEDYRPLGATDFMNIAKSIKLTRPDFVINTINGDSNASFFAHYSKSGNKFPVLSFSIPEHNLSNLGIQNAEHYLCWSYFQSLDNKANERFLRDFGEFNKKNLIASAPMVMTYSQIRIWVQAVEEAGSFDIDAVRTHLHGQRLNSPAGLLEVMPNNHILKSAFIGKQVSGNKFQIIWKSDKRVKPEPWLGIEKMGSSSARLIKDALTQYPNLINLNVELRYVNTELKKAKEELESSWERLRILFEFAPDAYYLNDLKGNFVDGNKAAEEIIGYRKDKLIGQNFLKLKLLSPNQIPKAAKLLAKNALGKSTGPDEFTLNRKDGEQIVVEIKTFPIKINNRSLVLGIARDITKRKRDESEIRRLSQAVKQSASVVVITDLNGNIEYVNPRFTELTGYTSREVIGKNPRILKSGKTPPEEYKVLWDTITSGREWRGEFLNKKKDGTLYWESATISPVKNYRNVITNFMAVKEDITERKRLEKQEKERIQLETELTERKQTQELLAKSEKKYSTLVEEGNDGIVIIQNGLMKFANSKLIDMTGFSLDEMLGKPLNDFVSSEYRKLTVDRYEKRIVGKEVPNKYEIQIITKDGSKRNVEINASIIEYEGEPADMAIIRDITDRKKVEAQLRESEERYRSIVEHSNEIFYVVGPDAEIIFVTPQAKNMLGYEPEEMTKMKWTDLITDNPINEEASEITQRAFKTGIRPKLFPIEFYKKNGNRVLLEIDESPVKDDKGKVIALSGAARDITERSKAAEKLRVSEHRYHDLIDGTFDMIQSVTPDGRFAFVNNAWLNTLGYTKEEVPKLHINQVIHHECLQNCSEIFKRTISGESIDDVEATFITKDNRPIQVEGHVTPRYSGDTIIATQGFFRDVTERKQAEEEVKKSQDRLQKAMQNIVRVTAATVETRDPYTAGHQQRVTDLALAIAHELGISGEQIQEISMASIVHDIGKIYVPSEILSKPGRLSEAEFNIIKEHPQAGYDIFKNIELPWPIAEIILQHHEKLDGSGYPRGLKGEDILLSAKIITVADVVEAMSAHRPYRPALGISKALDEISQKKGILYDSKVVDACLRLFAEGRFKF